MTNKNTPLQTLTNRIDRFIAKQDSQPIDALPLTTKQDSQPIDALPLTTKIFAYVWLAAIVAVLIYHIIHPITTFDL